MKLARLLAAAAALALPLPATAQEGPTQAVRLCENLTLYAGAPETNGTWTEARIEDARGGSAVTYTASSARVGQLRGAPAVLLQNGQVQVLGTDGRAQTLSFEEFVVSSCPEAALHAAN